MEFILELKIVDLIFEYLIKSSLVLLMSFLMVSLFFYSLHSAATNLFGIVSPCPRTPVAKTTSLGKKYFILSFSLISLLLFPLLSSLTIGWETPLLPSWSSEPISSSAANKAPDENELYFQSNFAEKNTLFYGIRETARDVPGSLWHGPLKNILGLSMLILWSVIYASKNIFGTL